MDPTILIDHGALSMARTVNKAGRRELRKGALVHGPASDRNSVFDGVGHFDVAVTNLQQTDIVRAHASIRLRAATPRAASVS